MEEQRLETYLNMSDNEATVYDDEKPITDISIPIYKFRAVNLMLLCVDIGAQYSCIGNKALERIVQLSGRKSVPVI